MAMHNNFYFLKQLTAQLQQTLISLELLECFSQNKNELVLGFAIRQQSHYIRATLNADFSCLSFTAEFHRSKKNSVDLFAELIGQPVVDVEQYENERSFMIHFENKYGLLFKLHGNRANILLCKNEEVVLLFKNNLQKDAQIIPLQLKRPIAQTWENFAAHDYQFQKLFPTFDKEIKNYLEESGYYLLSPEKQWEFLQQLTAQLSTPPYYVLNDQQQKPLLSMLKPDKPSQIFQEPIPAINYFYNQYTREYYLQKEKQAMVSQLQNQRKQVGNYVVKAQRQLDHIQQNSRSEELANIIMANLHAIPPKATEVELYDFYNDQMVNIKLKKDQTPQKNAETLYRKSKNQKLETDNLEKNISAKSANLATINRHLKYIIEVDNLKELRQYIKAYDLQKTKANTAEELPFRQFTIYGYDILVGKNAKNNDELTTGYAKKDDLWLHAKDVSGSHVIIKHKSGSNFPANVIEKAAGLAAYYSKRKNDTLCPVLYTPKKYVFKSKGMAPGKVRVEKEKVIMVPPSVNLES
jgi:predicted ribosome quality control (RQC) complex YloA/Tae2 family protein